MWLNVVVCWRSRGFFSGWGGICCARLKFVPFVAEVTRVRSLVTVAEPDVDFQSRQRRAGHVAEGTLDLID